ncbi:glycosyltransferase family 2 protein [Paludisphaera soli]|uniref:glycosyltransferase family 2 protein n=1 Tax=Paludisphaera soli TaxID=2712865 RepID=UPI0013ED8F5F|nr:glycosyltransferase family 2 protein [Paludisphaera soli]
MDPSPRQPQNRPEPPRLTVVVVNYDGWPDVAGLLDRLVREPEFLSGACRAVVVDNASPSPRPDAEVFRRPGLRLVLRPDNGGFAVGVNAGWRASPAPWLLLLNPDVAIEPGTLGRILERLDALEARPEGPPGVVGFGLRNEDGSHQGSVGVFPSLARSFREQLTPRRRRKYVPSDRLRPGEVDWVTGACMLIHGALMAELGGLDEDFFLYHEEVDFCRRARDRGWRIEYDPGVTVVHRAPLQDRPISPKMRVVIRHSKLLYFRKHAPRRQFLALARIVELEAAARGAWAAVRKLQAERRAWKVVGEVARRLRRGGGPLGRRVIELAERAESGEPGVDDGGRRLGDGPNPARARRPARASRASDG